MNSFDPEYLCCVVVRKKHPCSLKSQVLDLFQMLKARLKTYGDRSFICAVAVDCNKKLLGIRKSPSVDSLRHMSRFICFSSVLSECLLYLINIYLLHSPYTFVNTWYWA